MTHRRCGYIIGLLAAGLAACEGGGVSTPESPPSVAATMTVEGRATKGPLAGARIELFATAPDGRTQGAAVASALTDQAGNWSATVPPDHQGLLVQSTGGQFFDESDPDPSSPRRVALAADDALLSYLPPGAAVASITLVSDALVRKARLEADNDNFATRLQSNRARYSTVLGLDPLATAAADPLAPVGTEAERRYALIAGGLAYALNALAVERGQAVADYATIDLLLDDLIDCRLDGLGLGGQVLYDISVLSGRSLNDEILRFRNNHFDDYDGLEVPALDTTGCLPSPGSNDIEPPVFTSVAAPLTLGAEDATGAPIDSPALAAALEAFIADDNRADSARIALVADQQLALGTSDVLVTATDGWGNVTSTTWTVTVADLTPPVLEAPASVQVDATAARTQVTLGSATAVDNVSSQLTISNNAPADGFVVGDTQVVWRAVDEAGLVAEATQTVTVVGTTPSLDTPVVALPGAVGSAIDVDLSAFFSDPFEATLIYRIAGLPVGSGLQLDAVSGRLTGIATAADLAASPLALTVTADNSQFSLDADFSLAIAPRQPEFGLSLAALMLDEDFDSAPQIIATPAQATPPGVLTFSASLDNPIAAVTVDAQGRVSVTAIPDAFGTARIDIRATNLLNNESVVQSIALQIAPINDAPVALVADERVRVLSDTPVDLNVRLRFEDVDDEPLELAATGLPASLSIGSTGRIEGTPQGFETNVPEYPLQIVATDAFGASATTSLVLQIDLADRDGDGLSDAREMALGTDPDAIDSDGDGVNDLTEVTAGADPLLPAANVIYVSPNGANNQSGASFAQALRDNDGLMMVPPGLSAAQPTFVIYAAGATAYAGNVWLMPPCDHIVFAGSVDEQSGRVAVSQSRAPVSRFTAQEAPSFEIDSCSGVGLQDLSVANNTRHGIYSELSTLWLDNVHLVNNRSEIEGGGLHIVSGNVQLRDVVASANRSARSGGAIALMGQGSVLSVRNARLDGNAAADSGGALFVEGQDASVTLDNVLMTTNSAERGGAVFGASVSTFTVSHATWAFNQTRNVSAGAIFGLAAGMNATVRDSVVFGNRDASQAIVAFDAGVASDFNSSDAVLSGGADLSVSPDARVFGEQYFLTDQARALDLGSVDALDAGLDQGFSAAGSVLPDAGVSDRGFHYEARPAATFDSASLGASVQSVDTSTPRYARYRAIDFVPRVDGQRIGPGHRVQIRPLNGRSDLIGAIRSVGPENRVRAIDLGDGGYRVYRRNITIAATQFELSVDDVVAARPITYSCALGACGSLPGELTVP